MNSQKPLKQEPRSIAKPLISIVENNKNQVLFESGVLFMFTLSFRNFLFPHGISPLFNATLKSLKSIFLGVSTISDNCSS